MSIPMTLNLTTKTIVSVIVPYGDRTEDELYAATREEILADHPEWTTLAYIAEVHRPGTIEYQFEAAA